MAVEYDFTKTPCDLGRLTQEIQLSSISSATLSYMNLSGSALQIFFTAALSANDQTTLGNVVTAHSGLPLSTVFQQLVATQATMTTSSNYSVLDTMVSPNLLAGTYIVMFNGSFLSNAPLLSDPGIFISVFNNGVQVQSSETSQVSGSVSLFPLSPLGMTINCSVVVQANQVLDIRWKTNGAGNTITCNNRILDILKVQ